MARDEPVPGRGIGSRLRIALFSTPSSYGERALAELEAAHDVVSVVLPGRPRSVLGAARRILPGARRSALETPAGGGRVLFASTDWEAVRKTLASLSPDLVCIALFPRRVPAPVLALARLGAINAHPSLLPRHRGPLPLFWTYHANDRSAGVTVHHATERLDAGDVIARDEFDLPRGFPVSELDAKVARHAGPLLCSAATRLAAGEAPRIPQDESAATHAPVVAPGARMVDFETWDAERVWHFLAGLAPQYREPLRDAHGRPAAYRRVPGYESGAAGRPGTLEAREDGWILHCVGGHVFLAP